MDRKNSSPPGNCRFAIPKKGRLYDKVTEMLKGSGIEFRREPRLDVALCVNFPITLVFLPASDIAKYVGKGNVDLGITGLDVVQESEVEVNKIMDLGFGKCKLCVQAPVVDEVVDVNDLSGKRIVTSFPVLSKKFFDPIDAEQGVKTSINFVSGSVEAACGLGLADAVVDLVETGTTMKVRLLSVCLILFYVGLSCALSPTVVVSSQAAGLEVVAEILSTEAVLIANPNAEHQDLVDMIQRRLEGFITANKYILIMYNISYDLLQKAVAITPGKRSPTITSLDDGGKAVSSLVLKKEVNDIMDQLHGMGATDILVMDISNSRM